MATRPRAPVDREIEYPTSDGKPMAETDVHRQNMLDLIETLKGRYAADPRVYVSGNLLLFYEEGDRRKHVAPDVFLVRDVPKLPPRKHYLLWREGKGPDVVIELTSKTTRREDQNKKLALYRDVLRVPEYFLFDPNADWLKPPMQGYRLTEAGYVAIEPVQGRLPSAVLGLDLMRNGYEFRLYDPLSERMLPTSSEQVADAEAARAHAEAARQQVALELRRSQSERQLAETLQLLAETRLAQSETRRELAETRQQMAEAEADRLRRELDALRRRLPGEA